MSAGDVIEYGLSGAAVSAFQRSTISPLPFETVLAGLRVGIEAAGLCVLHEIDPRMILRRGGHAIRPARQILFFHPNLMIRLLRANAAALLEAPLKLAVLELPGGTVAILWINPGAAFARYDNEALADLGREFADRCDRIVAEAAPRPAVEAPMASRPHANLDTAIRTTPAAGGP